MAAQLSYCVADSVHITVTSFGEDTYIDAYGEECDAAEDEVRSRTEVHADNKLVGGAVYQTEVAAQKAARALFVGHLSKYDQVEFFIDSEDWGEEDAPEDEDELEERLCVRPFVGGGCR